MDAFRDRGLVMYGALYSLFLALDYSRREIRSKFATLSDTHERLIQTEKLSAMGQMVSEIAHQLNNPLVGVINLAELADREIGNPARVKELLGEVRSAGEHCREYVQRVLQLSQLTRSEQQPADISRLARDTVGFFQQSLGSRPSVTIEAPSEPLISDVDENLVRNALFNLIHNASQADPDGRVLISIARSPDRRAGVRLRRPIWVRFSARMGRQIVYTILHDAAWWHRAWFVNRAAYCHSARRDDQRREQAQRRRKFYDVDCGNRGDKVKSKILLVDDDPFTQRLFQGLLRSEDVELRVAANMQKPERRFARLTSIWSFSISDCRMVTGWTFSGKYARFGRSKCRSSLPAMLICAMPSAPCATDCWIT